MDVEPGWGRGPRSPGFGLLDEGPGWLLAAGIVLIALGMMALILPFVFTLATGFVVGTLLVISGVVQGFHAFHTRRWTGLVARLILALLTAVAGILLYTYPIAGAAALTLILGSYLVITGVFRTILGFQVRPQPAWGWTVASGILSTLLGLFVWLGWPVTATWVIGVFVGVDLLMAGWSLVALSLASGRAAPRDAQ